MQAEGLDEHSATLRRLADALDISPAAFLDPTVCDLNETTELLRLWHRIDDGQDRAKVLAIVRSVASRA